uniref:Calpain_III domain-containing protein n=1 Tax=Globodera pallida TaxID=36090 RepID=A0A183CSP7_GLOPA
ELADFQGLSDGPRVGADQLQRHLKNGAATALIATATKGGGQNCEKLEEVGEKEMVVGYAVYFVCPSVQFGKVFFLEVFIPSTVNMRELRVPMPFCGTRIPPTKAQF